MLSTGSSRTAKRVPFYLHVESFDPHEPWDPPADFLRKYYSGPATPSWPEPPYANIQVPRRE